MTEKESLNKLYILFNCFNCRFRQASKCPQYFKADILAQSQCNRLGNCNGQISKLLQKLSSYLWFLHCGKDFRSSYITFDIFNNLTFFGTAEKTYENYKFSWYLRHKSHHRFLATTFTPTETITNLVCSFFVFVFICLYNSKAMFEMQIFLHIVFGSFFYLLMLQSMLLLTKRMCLISL